MSALQRRHDSSGEELSVATTFCTCTGIRPCLSSYSTFEVGIGNEVEMVELLYLPSVVSRVYDKRGRADALDNLRRKETLDDDMGAKILMN